MTNEIPPELQQKIQEAMNKVKNNPSLFNMIGTLSELSKNAKAMGALPIMNAEQIKNLIKTGQVKTTISQSNQPPVTVSETFASRPTIRKSQPPAHYNPAVKTDRLRNSILLAAIIFLIGYCFYYFNVLSII